MKRAYQSIAEKHLKQHKQMLFLAGPRQVGKTTISLSLNKKDYTLYYLNWDNDDDQKLILSGPNAIVEKYPLDKISSKTSIVIFDEIHKYRRWKNFLKGFFDSYQSLTKVIVTGSAKLNIYQRGGDSLMGRYFLYRIHPLSVAECIHTKLTQTKINFPKKIKPETFKNLLQFGGFPEPFLESSTTFTNQWRRLWNHQLFREDLRQITMIQSLPQIELLAELLKEQVGELTNYSNLAKKTQVSVPTIKNWLASLQNIYYCFNIKPWSNNVIRSLLKQPKYYLWDWSMLQNEGTRHENFAASHLLKAIQFWNDSGLGNFGLYFIRDKENNEIDFLVTENKKPWFIVEVKSSSSTSISKSLYKFHKQLKTKHAFQIVFDMDYVNKDCFSYTDPVIVPAQTFLSQLF